MNKPTYFAAMDILEKFLASEREHGRIPTPEAVFFAGWKACEVWTKKGGNDMNEQQQKEATHTIKTSVRNGVYVTIGWACATMPIDSLTLRLLIAFVFMLFVPRVEREN